MPAPDRFFTLIYLLSGKRLPNREELGIALPENCKMSANGAAIAQQDYKPIVICWHWTAIVGAIPTRAVVFKRMQDFPVPVIDINH